MSLYQKLRGTVETLFQIGLAGPQWKNAPGPPVAIEARNSTDATHVLVRAASPTSGIGTGSDAELVPQRALQRNFHRAFMLMGG